MRWTPLCVASVLSLLLGISGTLTVAFTDYEVEAEPAAQALARGDLASFAHLAPAYGGSFVLRAPFAWLGGAFGLTDLGLYRMLVLPALAAAAGLAVWLFGQLADRSRAGAWVALVLVVANPLTLRALDAGHPEEVVGGVLCVAAVLAAQRDRTLLAGLLLGLAVANKPWALLAIGPVLLALGDLRARLQAGVLATAAAGAILGPLVVWGAVGHAAGEAATPGSAIFQPWQVFWFLGHHGEQVVGLTGIKVGFRTAPGWIGPVSHPLVLLAGAAATAAYWPRRRREDALGLLALVLLLRCGLDTWNTSYYAVPLTFACVAFEVCGRRRAPWASAALVLALWHVLLEVDTPDVAAALYLVVFLAAASVLLLTLWWPARAHALTGAALTRAARCSPTLAARWPAQATSAS